MVDSIKETNKSIRISMHQVDVAFPEQIEQMLAEVESFHKTNVDILVSNAGYGKRIRDIWDIPLSEFDHTINVNMRASFVLARGVAKAMADQRWGRMIFISSIAAYGGGINGCRKCFQNQSTMLIYMQTMLPPKAG